jgi:uncharacterized delta-60 repeat protein
LLFPQNAGDLDLSFGGTGFVTTSIGTANTMSYSMVIQNNDKIIVAGNSIINGSATITLIRYLPDGSLDFSFGDNGIVTSQVGIASSVYSITLQQDNKIIAAGVSHINESTTNFSIIRYNQDGVLDDTFGDHGVASINIENSSNVYNVAIKSDQKIVISGYSNFNSNTGISLIQLNIDGTLDTNFGTGGISIHHFVESPDVEAWAMDLDGNDNIITTGMIYDSELQRNKIAVVKFKPNGDLDEDFGINGIVKTSISSNSDDFGNAVTIQPNNKIVIAGTSNNLSVIARYNIDGTLDYTFGTNGIIITSFETGEPAETYGITIQSDGNIVAVGVSGQNAQNTNGNFGLIRLNPDGTIDDTFGLNGKVVTDISNGHNDVAFSVKEQNDGKLVVSGISKSSDYYNIAVAKYNGQKVPIQDYTEEKKIQIFPNPAFDKIEITGLNNNFIEIINTQGQIVKKIYASDSKTKIDISKLSSGFYTVLIKTDKEIIVKKIIKQ